MVKGGVEIGTKYKSSYLKQKQALPLEAKIKLAQQRIQEWYEHWDGQVYISFSGGKDSTVLLHLVKSMYPDVPAVFCNTGLEYPEVRQFGEKMADVVIKPKLKFTEVLSKYGYPIISKEVAKAVDDYRRNAPKGKRTLRMRQLDGEEFLNNGKPSFYDKSKYRYLVDADFLMSDKCCYHMKKSPMAKYEKDSGRKPYVGIMADESLARKSAYLKTGCNSFTKSNPMSKPLSVWTEQDILKYLKENELEYASVYGEIVCDENGEYSCTGVDRTGCIFCGFGAHLDDEPNRFQRLKNTHPRQYAFCMRGGVHNNGYWMPNKEGLGMEHVLKHIGVKTE